MPAGDGHHRPPTAELGDHLWVRFDAVGGEERAVLDAVHTGRHGIGDALTSVSVRGDLQPGRVRRGHGGASSSSVYCDSCGPIVGVMFPPVTMILITSTPPTHPVVHGLADAVTTIGLAAEEPAVATGHRERRTRREDLRPDLGTAAKPIAQRQREVVAVSEVPDRGDPTRQRPQRGHAHPQQQRRIVALQQMGHRIVRGIERQVLVDIDQAGQHGHITEVDQIGTRPSRPAAATPQRSGRPTPRSADLPRSSRRGHQTSACGDQHPLPHVSRLQKAPRPYCPVPLRRHKDPSGKSAEL